MHEPNRTTKPIDFSAAREYLTIHGNFNEVNKILLSTEDNRIIFNHSNSPSVNEKIEEKWQKKGTQIEPKKWFILDDCIKSNLQCNVEDVKNGPYELQIFV